jgi:hypothetical protein
MKTFSNVANQCHLVPFPRSDPRCAKPRSEAPEPIAHDLVDGDCSNPFREETLNRFWAWRSGMETFSKAANQCHFVPCSRTNPRWAKPRSETLERIVHAVAKGQCSNPFWDRGLNCFWAWRSGMKTF